MLTAEQADAFRRLEDAAAAHVFKTLLLHGVTGSGKTELYLRLSRRVVDSGPPGADSRARDRPDAVGGRAVPRIGSASGSRSSTAGCPKASVTTSGTASGAATWTWSSGTRSAVFAPIDRLGLIVVDEEQDGSYKQDESPRYHGRDVAVVRGRAHGALVVLGSATPSLESSANARSGRYDLIRLTRRILDRPLATRAHRQHARRICGARRRTWH